MNRFPMIKTRLSNEHVMAGVLLVLVLYHLPRWLEDPSGILTFVLMVCFGLLIDAVAGFLRYKRLWCCVSGAVTAAIISLLSPGVPLWAQLLAVAFGLLAGKHIQGGTGKNISNPAMAGMVVILLFFDMPDRLFTASLLLLPAVLLGLVFLYFRPFAGISFVLGMLTAMLLVGQLTPDNVLSYGVFFWACIIMTDPVTVTPKPVTGSILSFVLSFAATYFFRLPSVMVAVILFINIFSEETLEPLEKNLRSLKARYRLPKPYREDGSAPDMIDLTGRQDTPLPDMSKELITVDEILDRIRTNEVYGMGGAAFPAWKKLKTVMASDAEDKYLIINAVECDPGLVHDKWLLMNHFQDIMKGIDLLNTCAGFKEIHLAVKDSGEYMQSLQLKVDQVPDQYPAGAEKILIKEVLGKTPATGQIPAEAGFLVLNVQTVYAIGRAVLMNEPTDTRFLTVADIQNKTAKVVRVLLGMKLEEIMEAVYPGTVNIYTGGGIMQSCLTEEGAVVDRSTNFIATGLMPSYKESPQCSRCGLCVKHCPGRLEVRRIAELVEKGKLKNTQKYKPEECISCGSCSYTCLAGHNLAAKVKQAKEYSQTNKAQAS